MAQFPHLHGFTTLLYYFTSERPAMSRRTSSALRSSLTRFVALTTDYIKVCCAVNAL